MGIGMNSAAGVGLNSQLVSLGLSSHTVADNFSEDDLNRMVSYNNLK